MTFTRSMCSNLDKHDVLKEFRKRRLAFLEDLESTECPSVIVAGRIVCDLKARS